jgi:PiT family inorganic phosphate transporter
MDLVLVGLALVIILALVFEYINGFHDAANAIATVVSTKVLTPKQAIAYAACLEFAGAIIWNLITWYYGIPSSSSHALIGGLMGASIAHSGSHVIKLASLEEKVLIPMVTSPFLGFVIGFMVMLLLLWLFAKSNPELMNKHFKKMQVVSAGIMALGHGSNDAQKTMGIITLALFSGGLIPKIDVPLWVIAICAITMSCGVMSGGWKIIRTMGSKVIKLKPIHGFAAETSAATVILAASHFGIPVSTTHIISTSIMGVGSTQRLSAVKWGVVRRIMFAWVVTIPACMLISSISYFVGKQIIGLFN